MIFKLCRSYKKAYKSAGTMQATINSSSINYTSNQTEKYGMYCECKHAQTHTLVCQEDSCMSKDTQHMATDPHKYVLDKCSIHTCLCWLQVLQHDGKELQPGLAHGSSAMFLPLSICDSPHTTEASKLAFNCICGDVNVRYHDS